MNTIELRALADGLQTPPGYQNSIVETLWQAADEIDRLTAERDAAFVRLAEHAFDCGEMSAKLAALAAQEPVALLAQGISGGIVGAERLYFPQERNEAIEFCAAAHEKGGYPVTEISPLYAAAGATPSKAHYEEQPDGTIVEVEVGAAPVPEDWQLVPKEPTDEMIDAYLAVAGFRSARSDWQTMLEAAPKEPS